MIEIDPRWYFPASYVLNWRCPHCTARVPVPNGTLHHAHCPRCTGPLMRAAAAEAQPLAVPKRLSA